MLAHRKLQLAPIPAMIQAEAPHTTRPEPDPRIRPEPAEPERNDPDQADAERTGPDPLPALTQTLTETGVDPLGRTHAIRPGPKSRADANP